MRTISAIDMTEAAFREYGTYADLYDPEQYKKNGGQLKFFRELAILNLGHETNVAFSMLRVRKSDCVVRETEYHPTTGEGLLILDGDVYIHVSRPSDDYWSAAENMEIFRVKSGTMVCLRPGVWHYEPMPIDKDLVNIVIMLPERAYSNDTKFITLPEEYYFAIETEK